VVLDGPQEGPVEDQVEGRRRIQHSGRAAREHDGGRGGARAALVDLGAGALLDPAQCLLARAGEQRLEVAARDECRGQPERLQRRGQLGFELGGEARQLDRALPAAERQIAPGVRGREGTVELPRFTAEFEEIGRASCRERV